MNDSQFILSLKDVRFRWSERASFALQIPNFAVKRGETVLLLGESGSGKSTLLSLICGTVAAQSGVLTVSGQDMGVLSGAARDSLRADQIGVIFQQFNLLPFGSVADNILLPLHFSKLRRARVKQPLEEVQNLCRALRLPEAIHSQKAASLSVGQQQRVAVARALIGRPALVIADEPTSALDAGTQDAFLEVLFGQLSSSDASLLMVSHDARLAKRFDRVLDLKSIMLPPMAA